MGIFIKFGMLKQVENGKPSTLRYFWNNCEEEL